MAAVAPPATPIDTDEFAHLERAFVENVSSVFSLPYPSDGVLSTPFFTAANPGAPYYFLNACMTFDGDAATAAGLDVGTQLARAVGHLSTAAAGFVFVVTPLSTPGAGDLDERLVRDHGLVLFRRPPVMAVRISDLAASPAPPLPEGYRIAEVTDPAAARAFAWALYEGFGVSSSERISACAEFYALGAGIAFRPALRHFAVYAPGDAGVVATASVWSHAGVAGVYNVATLPAHRGCGLASALVRTVALAGDAASGVAVLQSTPRAVSVYRRLGWRVTSGYRVYVPAKLAAEFGLAVPAGAAAAAAPQQ